MQGCRCCRFVSHKVSETKPQMVPTDLNIYIYIHIYILIPRFGSLIQGTKSTTKRGGDDCFLGGKNASQGVFISYFSPGVQEISWYVVGVLNKRSANPEISMVFMMYYSWCKKSCTTWYIYMYTYLEPCIHSVIFAISTGAWFLPSTVITFHWWHFLWSIYAGRSHGKSIQISPQCFQQKVLQTSQCSKALKIIELGGRQLLACPRNLVKGLELSGLYHPNILHVEV